LIFVGFIWESRMDKLVMPTVVLMIVVSYVSFFSVILG
jgi:hypothetical protein